MKKVLFIAVFVSAGYIQNVFAQNYNFSRDLTVGSSGDDVISLQTWLISKSFDIPAISSGKTAKGYFGEQTRSAVASYQKSVGLPAYGFFGYMTRASIDSSSISDSRSPTISSLDGPVTLYAGQKGSWTVNAADPDNSQLSYYIYWGDSASSSLVDDNISSSVARSLLASTSLQFSQSTAFTHIYPNSGTYKIIAIAKNKAGLTAQIVSMIKVTNFVSPAFLKVISPNGGEKWRNGTEQAIAWVAPTNPDVGAVDISVTRKYICTGQVCPMIAFASQLIASRVSIDRESYLWKVGTTVPVSALGGVSTSTTSLASGDYTIQICESDTNICDSSDVTFNIEN